MAINLEKLADVKEATLHVEHKTSRDGGEMDCLSKLYYDDEIIGRMSAHISNSEASDMKRLKEMHLKYFAETLEEQKYKVKVSGDTISISR
jgi:hypothetical protein